MLEQEFKIKSHHVIFSQTNLLLKPRMFDCFFVCSSSFVVLKSGCVLFLSNLPSAPKDEIFRCTPPRSKRNVLKDG